MSAAREAEALPPPEERTADWKRGTETAAGKAKSKGKVRPKKARIDIDARIDEANRLADMLKKVQGCARNMKKTSQRSKKRIVAKASRLSQADLERIAMLKRCGMVPLPEDCDGTSPVSPPPSKEARSKHSEALRQSIVDQLNGLLNLTESQGPGTRAHEGGMKPSPSSPATFSHSCSAAPAHVQLPTEARLCPAGAGAFLRDVSPLTESSQPEAQNTAVHLAAPPAESQVADFDEHEEQDQEKDD